MSAPYHKLPSLGMAVLAAGTFASPAQAALTPANVWLPSPTRMMPSPPELPAAQICGLRIARKDGQPYVTFVCTPAGR